MIRYRAWGLAAALAAAGPAAVAADPPPPPPRQTTLFDKLFGETKPKPGPTARRLPTVTAPLPAEVVASALRAEQDAWDRRMAVCLRLREAALAANDDALMRQVDELEREAAALYAARTAALGVPKAKGVSAAEAASVLDRHLGSGAAVTPLSAPAAPVPATPADASNRSAALRGGVRP